MKPRSKEESEALYRSVEKLIVQMTKAHQRKYGGEWEDLLGEANLLYCVAVDTFQEGMGSKFSSWVSNGVKNGLDRKALARIRHQKCHQEIPTTDIHSSYSSSWEEPGRTSLLEALLPVKDSLPDETTQDARDAMCEGLQHIHFDTSSHHKRPMGVHKGKGTPLHHTVQGLLERGWTEARVRKAFQEVQEALALS